MVDDEPWALRGVREIIPWEAYGFTSIDTYQNPQEALNAIIRTKPDVVFTDVRMPGMTGLELIERCREAGSNALFVIVSAYAEFEYAKKAMDIGATSYILKPLEDTTVHELAQKLQKMLSKRKNSELVDSVRSLVLRVLTTGNASVLDPNLERSGLFEKPCRIAFMADKPKGMAGECFRIYSDLLMMILPEEDHCLQGVTTGISRSCESSDQVPAAVWQALVAYYTQRFYGAAGMMEYRAAGKGPGKLLEGIIHAVEKGDVVKAQTNLNQLKKFLLEERSLIHEVTFAYNELLKGLLNLSPQKDVQEELRRFGSCFQMYGVMHSVDVLFSSIRILVEDCLQRTSEDVEPEDAAERAVRYVNKHYNETLTLEQISEQFNISLSHLCRQFKRITGAPFTEYVTRRRIEQACVLLKGTQLPIAQIGEQVGYPDYFYFNKVFKKVQGVSPSVYRREGQKDARNG